MKNFFSMAMVCVALAVAPSARADDASHRAAVLELFKLMDMERLMQESMDAMLDVQFKADPQSATILPKIKEFFAKHMSWKVLQDDFLALYKKTFTEAELKQLLAFYKTDVGKKTLREMPKLMQQGAQIGAARVQQHMPELMKMLQAEAAKSKPK